MIPISMYYLSVIFLVACGSAATFNDAAGSLYLAATDLQHGIDNYDPRTQKLEVLGGEYHKLSSALTDFAQSATGVSTSDLDVEATSHVAAALIRLIDSLSFKIASIEAAGISKDVSAGIDKLRDPTLRMVNGLVRAAGGDTAKWADIGPKIDHLEQRLNAEYRFFELSRMTFSPYVASSTTSSSSPTGDSFSTSSVESSSSANSLSADVSTGNSTKTTTRTSVGSSSQPSVIQQHASATPKSNRNEAQRLKATFLFGILWLLI